jgi:hypothetical protein
MASLKRVENVVSDAFSLVNQKPAGLPC